MKVPQSCDDIIRLLEDEGIAFQRFDHVPVFTCEEARSALPEISGHATKNLFLRDEKGRRHVLLVVADDKSVDLKGLSKALGMRPLSLASADRLKAHLGLEPGSVTLLGAFADVERNVEVVIDQDLERSGFIHCHPLVNTATLVIGWDDVLKLLRISGHEPVVCQIPVRASSPLPTTSSS